MNENATIPEDLETARRLIGALVEQTITPGETDELERLISGNREVRRLYVRMMHLHASLYRHAPVLGSGGGTGWAYALKMSALAAAGILAIGGVWLWRAQGPTNQTRLDFAAKVVRVAEPVFEAGTPLDKAGKGLMRGEASKLQSGCVEMEFSDGCRVIVEGPAEFTAVSGEEMDLKRGRMHGEMVGGGFVVKTPTSVIRDLGTQFGVAVQPSGASELDVFQGRVAASVRHPEPNGGQADLIVYEGQAVHTDGTDIEFDPVGAVPQRFVSSLTSEARTLDVADLFSGGDGTTRRRGMALDTTTGRFGALAPVGPRFGATTYRPVSALTVVDGCFVPDGTVGLNTVDSAGHQFQFPSTDGVSIEEILSGGSIAWFRPVAMVPTLGGIDYSTPNHSLMVIHSNNGVTFDLEAIRRLHPGREITGFHCTAGNTFTNGYKTETGFDPMADIFVVVDGKSRFEKQHFIGRNGVLDVNVPLSDADRFFTMATTDGSDGINDDWVLWADPIFSLTAR